MSAAVPQQPFTIPIPANETERLAALQRYKILDTPPEAAFDRITRLAARLFGVPTVIVSLIDESRAWFKSCVGFEATEVPRDNALCSFALLSDDPLIIPDARLDDRFAYNPLVQAEPGVRFYAGAPLISHDGFNLGTLCLLDSQLRDPLTAEQQATLVDLAAMVVDELDLRLAARMTAQSEEKYRLLFESIDEGFCTIEVLFDADGKPFDHRILQANPAFEQQSGIANPEGKIASELAPGVEQYWNDLYAQVINIGESVRTEVHSDALNRWFDVLVSRVGDAAMCQVATVLTDISDRKRMEFALRESEERFRTLADNMSQFAWMADGTGWIFWYNQRWFDYTGTTLEMIQGWSWQQMHHPDHVDRVIERFRQCLETGEPWEDTFPLRSRDGTYRWFLSRALPIRDEQGKISRWFGTNTDISDRKQIEVALQASEKQSRNILESITDAFFAIDEDWRFTYVNETAYMLVDRIPEDLIGKDFWQEFPGLYGSEFEKMHRRVMRDHVAESLTAFYPDHDRWYEVRTYPAANGIVVYFNNVTDRKAAEAEREKLLLQEQAAREEAERANRIKDEFLAVLSHELRSPLNPILGWARLLQNRSFTPARQQEALATIERNAKLQSQLIEDLLDISRIMQGKLTLTATPIGLESVIAAAVETVRLAADAKNVQITPDLDPDVPPVFGDAARLQQVIWNLLTNAVKFTNSGGQVTVQLNRAMAEGMGTMAQIQVIDTGKGINPQFLPHVFEYFRQEDGSTTRRFGGLGLGLAIVRQIVELHGGMVKAESRGEQQGATFIVQLPTLQASPLTLEPIQAQATSEARLKNVKVLLVDDDTDTREFETFLLEQYGAKVIAVASSAEALQKLDQSLPDVIVSDIGMADIDGYALMQQIRSRPPAQGGMIRAIALTAYAAEIDQQKALQSGYQKHLTKPIEPEQLINAIITLIGVQQNLPG